jgi:hypothetical protein
MLCPDCEPSAAIHDVARRSSAPANNAQQDPSAFQPKKNNSLSLAKNGDVKIDIH